MNKIASLRAQAANTLIEYNISLEDSVSFPLNDNLPLFEFGPVIDKDNLEYINIAKDYQENGLSFKYWNHPTINYIDLVIAIGFNDWNLAACYAAGHNDYEFVRDIIINNLDTIKHSLNLTQILNWACYSGSLKIVKYIVEIADEYKCKLHYSIAIAICMVINHYDIVKYFMTVDNSVETNIDISDCDDNLDTVPGNIIHIITHVLRNIISIDEKSLNNLLDLLSLTNQTLDWDDIIEHRLYHNPCINYINPLTKHEQLLHKLWTKYLPRTKGFDQCSTFFKSLKEYDIELNLDIIFMEIFEVYTSDDDLLKEYFTITDYLDSKKDDIEEICRIIAYSTDGNDFKKADYVIDYYINVGISIEEIKDNLDISYIIEHSYRGEKIDYFISKKLIEPNWNNLLDISTGCNDMNMVQYFVEKTKADNPKLALDNALAGGYASAGIKIYLFEAGNIPVEGYMFAAVANACLQHNYNKKYEDAITLLTYMINRMRTMNNPH
jgi:hypothetical protein